MSRTFGVEPDFHQNFVDKMAEGAERHRMLWLRANEIAVEEFRRVGLGSELESRQKQIPAAIAATLFRVLNLTTGWDTADRVTEKMRSGVDAENEDKGQE